MLWREIFETPLADLHLGSIQNHSLSFTDRDAKFLRTPKYRVIADRKLSRVPFDFYVYIVDNERTEEVPRASKGAKGGYSKFFGIETDENDRYDMMELVGRVQTNVMMRRLSGVQMLIVHNDPDAERWMPLTPWMILHRLAHAVLDKGQMGYTHLNGVKECWLAFEKLTQLCRLPSDPVSDPWDRGLQNTSLRSMFSFSSKDNAPNFDDYEIYIEMFVSYLYNGGKLKYRLPEGAQENALLEIKQEMDKVTHLFGEITQELYGVVWMG